MRHLDLFAGIGGFSRAVEWLGGRTVAFVEWEAWNRRVLAKHWPEARFYGDIRTVTADDISGLGRIDLITGGYPCQPFSHAGKRLGTEDDRHLWPEMRRVIGLDRKSTRLNSSHVKISYAVFCLKKKKQLYVAESRLP